MNKKKPSPFFLSSISFFHLLDMAAHLPNEIDPRICDRVSPQRQGPYWISARMTHDTSGGGDPSSMSHVIVCRSEAEAIACEAQQQLWYVLEEKEDVDALYAAKAIGAVTHTPSRHIGAHKYKVGAYAFLSMESALAFLTRLASFPDQSAISVDNVECIFDELCDQNDSAVEIIVQRCIRP